MDALVTHDMSNDFDTAKSQIIDNFVKIQQGVSSIDDEINSKSDSTASNQLADMEQRMNNRIDRITRGTDDKTTRLVVMAILQEQGVIK
ncbi:hypothetical protein LGV77_08445 [Lactiplantibacillus plantarum]|uniref:hypothetical protein n=1 Tax=Lactiplantibacillus plantarum TaxID=1590 RepID=UPI0021069CD5|nr:hypothetical protein [Lactiplantibacillus plantarum]MDN7039276.1 hypothetical protein [Lactiplantibacillus plantarum]UTV82577.1 hypothetical protein LGV77_08445 [Lactiplantibacillus plantarum]